MSRQKELDADTKAIQQIEFVEQIKKTDDINVDREQTKFVLTILHLNFFGVNRLFFLVYSNQDNNTKRFKSQRYYLPKGVTKNYNFIINRKIFMIKQLILI